MAGPLHVLDDVSIASPCPIPWDRIGGDGPVRTCPVCEKNVFDVMELTTGEASELFAAHDRFPCMRLCKTGDGRILTADQVPGVRGRIWKRLRNRVPWAASLFAMLFLPGCAGFINSFFSYGLPARSVKRPISVPNEEQSHTDAATETIAAGSDNPKTP